jgi:hypothetical protein
MYFETVENVGFRLTEQNFVMYAMKHYMNPQCVDMREFQDDLKRIKYIKRLFSRYLSTGELKERLILNHLIILYNVFGVEAATKLLFFKIEPKYWSQLKTFLVYLNCMPDFLYGASSQIIISSDIKLDNKIVSILRTI